MARYCTFYTENPYEPCMNVAVKGTYRCQEHPNKARPGRAGDMTSAIRQSVLARDNYKCVECGQPATEVNHIIPFASFPPEEKARANSLTNLESLCMKDHAVKTAKQRKDWIIVDDPDDFSTSARNRKKKRMRKRGFYY